MPPSTADGMKSTDTTFSLRQLHGRRLYNLHMVGSEVNDWRTNQSNKSFSKKRKDGTFSKDSSKSPSKKISYDYTRRKLPIAVMFPIFVYDHEIQTFSDFVSITLQR